MSAHLSITHTKDTRWHRSSWNPHRGVKRDTFPVIGQLNRVAIVSIMASVAVGGNSFWGFRQGGRGGGFGLADWWRTVCKGAYFFAGCHGVQRTRDLAKYECGE